MRSLLDAWIDMMTKILFGEQKNFVEDYLEILNMNTTFSCNEADKVLINENMKRDYREMCKVFFSQEKNIFGHNYSDSILSPITSRANPISDIAELLRENSTTRKAVLTYAPYGDKKIPCINCVHFIFRENRLNISYFSRGQDIFRKFPLDALCIIETGKQVAELLGVEMGFVSATITSAHIYNSDADKAATCCKNFHTAPRLILTSNEKKYSPLKEFFERTELSLSIQDLKIPEIQSEDVHEVVAEKAKFAFEKLGKSIWVDDSFLLLDAYPKFPGALTKYFFKTVGVEGLKKLLTNEQSGAKMICLMAYFDGDKVYEVEGESSGFLDFSQPIKNLNMPLSSIFICEEPFRHRRIALEKILRACR